MAKKTATTQYIQDLITILENYSIEIQKEIPYRLRNTSGFFEKAKISFYRFNCYMEDENIDVALRKQLKDQFSFLTSCLDEYNLRYIIECKKNKTPFTQEELVAFKRYHKSLDNWAFHQENQQRIAEKEIAVRKYHMESYV